MMSGYLLLVFKLRCKTLTLERWGLAETLLSPRKDVRSGREGHVLERDISLSDTSGQPPLGVEYGMKEWYRRDAIPDIKGYRVEMVEEEVMGHEGLRLAGHSSGIRQALRFACRSLTLHPHPVLLSGYVWHCPESNRLFSVRATHSPGEDIAGQVRDRIRCHQKGN